MSLQKWKCGMSAPLCVARTHTVYCALGRLFWVTQGRHWLVDLSLQINWHLVTLTQLCGFSGVSSPHPEMWSAPTLNQVFFSGYPNLPWKKSYDQPTQHIKIRHITLPTKVRLVKAMVFPAVMYGVRVGYKESWGPKNWCFWTVVLEKTLESPLDYNEIQPVNPKGNQSWIFTERTHAEAETPILWPPDVKNWLIWKDPDAGKE